MKERLTGAIILVALIVLVVPELLTGPLRGKSAGTASGSAGASAPSAADAPSSKASSSEASSPVRSYTLALTRSGALTPSHSGPTPSIGGRTAGQSASKPSPEVHPVAASVADRSLPRSAPSKASPRAAARIAPAPKPVSPGGAHSRGQAPVRHASPPRAARTPVRHTPQAAGRWVVQLASFSRHANALRLARRLRRGHFPVVVAPLRLRGRLWWRVWVGPVKDRAVAQRLARRLRPIGLRGEVLRE